MAGNNCRIWAAFLGRFVRKSRICFDATNTLPELSRKSNYPSGYCLKLLLLGGWIRGDWLAQVDPSRLSVRFGLAPTTRTVPEEGVREWQLKDT